MFRLVVVPVLAQVVDDLADIVFVTDPGAVVLVADNIHVVDAAVAVIVIFIAVS